MKKEKVNKSLYEDKKISEFTPNALAFLPFLTQVSALEAV